MMLRQRLLHYSFALMLGALTLLPHQAFAQFNAFKDPTAATTASGSADFKAVTDNIAGGKVAVGSTAYVVVLFRNTSPTSIKVGKINLYPSSTVTAEVTLNQCADAPLSTDAQCAMTVAVRGVQPGAWRVEMLVDHDGRSRIATASMNGEVEAVASVAEKAAKGSLQVLPDTFDFGTSAGGMELIKSLIISNSSSEDIDIWSVRLTAPASSGFSYDSKCPDILQPEETCSILLRWLPTTAGIAQGVLAIDHSGKSGMIQTEFKGNFEPPPVIIKNAEDDQTGSVQLLPDAVNFGQSKGGIEMIKSVLLANYTTQDIDIWDVNISTPDESGFTFESKCYEVLRPGETCAILLKWLPTTKGMAQGVLSVNHSGTAGIAQLEINGEFIPEKIAEIAEDQGGTVKLAPEAIDFGISKGGIELIKSISFGNYTTQPVDIKDIILTSPKESGFSYESQCPPSLKVGETCGILLKWLPTTKGPAQGVLAIKHSGTSGMAQLEMKGDFTPETLAAKTEDQTAKVQLTPETIDFGTSKGGIELIKPFVLANDTAEEIDIWDMVLTAPEQSGFSYQSKCPDVLRPQETCTIIMKWLPTFDGPVQGILTINHSGKSGMTQAELKGDYTPESLAARTDDQAAKVQLTPEAIDFGTSKGGIELIKPFVLANDTAEEIDIWDMVLTAPEQSGFSYQSKCPDVLRPQETCTIIMKWLPTFDGPVQGILTINHSGKSGMTQAELKGDFVPEPIAITEEDKKLIVDAELSPETLDFGSASGGITMVKSVLLTNQSLDNLDIWDVNLSAADAAGLTYQSQCPDTLRPDESCNIIVEWLPTTKGQIQGVLSVQHSGRSGLSKIEIKGSMQTTAAAAAATYPDTIPNRGILVSNKDTIDFGSSIKDDVSITLSMVNSGDADLELRGNSLASDTSGLYILDKGCSKNTILKPNEACPITVKWSPVRKGSILDSLQIYHTGVRGVLVVPIKGAADEASSKSTGGRTTTVITGKGSVKKTDSEDMSSPGKGSVEDLLKQLPVGDGEYDDVSSEVTELKVTSISQKRAVLKGTSGSMVVRDGESMVIDNVRWKVTVIPTGVLLNSKKHEVALSFDRALRSLADSAATSVNVIGGGSSNSPAASSSPPSAGGALRMINP